MATIDINEATVKSYIEKMRPQDLEIRKKLDYGYSYDGRTLFLHEIRPDWQDATIIDQHQFAKIRYYKSRGEWHLYWMRASGKWESYEPLPEATHLAEILAVIDEDQYGCFHG